MKWNKKFEYPKSQRSLIEGKRHYDIDDTEQTKLPSGKRKISSRKRRKKRKNLMNPIRNR